MKTLYIIFGIILVLCVFEATLFGFAYFNADKITCNWLWCEFTSTRSISKQECYSNNVVVNCSEMFHHNTFFVGGVQ